MKVTWYGTASVLLETEEGSLLFDPYLKDLPRGTETEKLMTARREAFERQKTVFITHGHFDHLSSIPSLYAGTESEIFMTKTPQKTLLAQGFPEEQIRMIAPGDVLSFPGFDVTVHQGRHIKFDSGIIRQSLFRGSTWRHFFRAVRLGIMDMKYPENGEICVYEVRAEGKTVLILGSAGLDDGTEYPVRADLLILPHQGRSDIDEVNRKIVLRLAPKRVVLDHYDDSFPPVSSRVETKDFCRRMSEQIPTSELREGTPVLI